jgi:hypothetical protein
MPCRVLSTKVQYATDITLIIKSIPENLKGVFLNLASQLALKSRLRTHHSCKSVRFKQLIRDLLSV